MRTLLRAVIPVPIRRLIARVWRAPHMLLAWWIVSRAHRPSSGEVAVFYGSHVPSPDQFAHGGLVKCQHMQQEFPNSPTRFNVLYLVSSRLPVGAVAMIRRAKRRRMAVVWNQNGVAYPAWHGPGWEQTNDPLATCLHHADYVFYQSAFCKVSADRYLGVRSGPWEILPNPVDTKRFTPVDSTAESTGLIMLLAGTQCHWYRVETALLVLARVAQVHQHAQLLITGQLRWMADQRRALQLAQERAHQLGVGDRVTFLGPYSQQQAPEVFRRAHVLLHTQYNDSCPGVVIEAMACGVPVVYSQSGGVPELVGQGAGIGIPTEMSWDREIPPDPEQMAQAVLGIMKDRRGYAHAARERTVERFDLRPWLKRHQTIFSELVRDA